MIYNNIGGRLKKIEQFLSDKDKKNMDILFITYENREENSNNNKKYYIKSNDILHHKPNANTKNNIELIYDNLENFYKDFNIKTRDNINTIIVTTD